MVRAIVEASRRDERARGPLEAAKAFADAMLVLGVVIDPHKMAAEFLAELEAERLLEIPLKDLLDL